jgi:hypothetical protein
MKKMKMIEPAFAKQQILQPTTVFAAKRFLSKKCDATFKSKENPKCKDKPRGGLSLIQFILFHWWRA